MALEEVGIRIYAIDEASGVISSAFQSVEQSQVQVASVTVESQGQMQSAMDQTASTTTSATSAITASNNENQVSMKDTALAMNNVGTSAMALYGAYDKVTNANLALKQATLATEKAQTALASAQKAVDAAALGQEKAQMKLEAAIEKFGAGSHEAALAQAELDLANQKVQISTDKLTSASTALEISQQKQEQASTNLSKSYIQGALTVVPSLITLFTSLSAITTGLTAAKGATTIASVSQTAADVGQTVASGALTTATTIQTAASYALGSALTFLSANPIVLIIAAIAALALALYMLYEKNETVRNAVDAFGQLLSKIFSGAVQLVIDILTRLWNDVLVPLGEFIGGHLTKVWNAISETLQKVFGGVVGWVIEKVTALWDVLKFVAAFLIDRLQVAWENMSAAFKSGYEKYIKPVVDALQKAYDIVFKPIASIIETIMGGLGKVGSAISGLFGGGGSSGSTTKMADGGIVTSKHYLMTPQGEITGEIGEAGPEAVVPIGQGAAPASSGGSGGGGSVSAQVTVNVNIGSVSSGENLQAIIDRLTTAVRQGAAEGLVDAVSQATGESTSRRLSFAI